MPTLLLSTMSLPAAPALAKVARASGWQTCALDETPNPNAVSPTVYYGGSDVAQEVAARFHLALLEPSLDLVARLARPFLQRTVEYGKFKDLQRLKSAAFIKPADALQKTFDAGIYSSARDIRAPKGIDPETPVLVAEPVEWLAEYRCFILEGKVAAYSPYLSFGRPVWKPYGPGGEHAQPSAQALAFCTRVLAESRVPFPPALVMDVGLIDDSGWAVVEFNPAWCSGLLGADPNRVLPVLQRACQDAENVSSADRRWVVLRHSS
jgi:hypothetical protein